MSAPQGRPLTAILARPVSEVTKTLRGHTDKIIKMIGLDKLSETDQEIITRVEKVAKKLGVSMANVATAWVLSKGHCPTVGISSVERVEDTLKAFDLKLSEGDVQYLEEPYIPKKALQ